MDGARQIGRRVHRWLLGGNLEVLMVDMAGSRMNKCDRVWLDHGKVLRNGGETT